MKYAITALVVTVLLAIGYFAFISRESLFVSPYQAPAVTNSTQRISTPPVREVTPTVVDSSDKSIEDDITALEKDLIEGDSLDNIFSTEINGL